MDAGGASAGAEVLRLGLEGELCPQSFESKARLGKRGLDCSAGPRFQGSLCGRGESMFKNGSL